LKNVFLNIDENGLEARISINCTYDEFPSKDELLIFLKENSIIAGIDEACLEKLVIEKESVEDVVIAKSDDLNNLLEWKIQINSAKPAITESDRADFKRLKLFEPVSENQVLISKNPTAGDKECKNIFGKSVKIAEKNIPFPQGENTIVSDDGLSLIATAPGYAVFEDGTLNVSNIYQVRGDVNYATGNVKFDGPVVIEGDIRSGFRVEATGSIYVGGNVEASSVYSQHGDITIQYGILGKNRAKILAGGSLTCGYIQDATVSVRKDVNVGHYVINTTISAGGRVNVDKEEGLIRGGSVVAEKGITALEVGSSKNTFTELKIRNTTENEGQNKIWDISRKRTELVVRVSALKKKKSFLSLLNTRVSDLSDTKRKEHEFVDEEISRLEKKIAELGNSEYNLQRESTKETMHKQIWVHGPLHGNVSIDIGGLGFFTDELINTVKIYRLKQEVIIESLADMSSTDYDLFVHHKQNMF